MNHLIVHVQATYGEDPSDFSREIAELESLRANACIRPSAAASASSDPSSSASPSAADAAKKYYCQLELLRRRFSGAADRRGLFDFTWYDCYLGIASNYSELEYEMASVLYNAGALHSQLGAREDR